MVDALSRVVPLLDGQLFILSMLNFDFLEQLHKSLHSSAIYLDLLQNIQQHLAQYSGFKVNRKLVFFQERIWIPSDSPFISNLLAEFHTTPPEQSHGVSKTLHRLQTNFFWPHMRCDVCRYVSQIFICQQTKYQTRKPTKVASTPAHSNFSMEGPFFRFYYRVIAITQAHCYFGDCWSFFQGHSLGSPSFQYTAHTIALLFLNLVCKLHDFPRSLVSDTDPLFISKF